MSNPPLVVPFSVEDELVQAIFLDETAKLPNGVCVDVGPDLPASYGTNRLQLMVQDPYWIYAYWEVTEALRKSALSTIPREDWDLFQMVIRLCELKENQSHWLDTGTVSSWWFNVPPAGEYQASLELYSPEYGHIPLLSSNTVCTPEVTLVPSAMEAQEEPTFLPWLSVLLEMTGIPRKPSEPAGEVVSSEDLILPRAEPESCPHFTAGSPFPEKERQENRPESAVSGPAERPGSFCVPSQEEKRDANYGQRG
jgi:hypothetical protein